MNSKLKIFLIVGIIVFVCGAAVTAAGVSMGGVKSVFFLSGAPKVVNPHDETQIERVDKTFTDVSAIDVNMRSMNNVVIKRGAEFSVKGQNFLAMGGLKATLGDDGTLAVTNSVKRSETVGLFLNDFSGLVNWMRTGQMDVESANNSVEITIPENTSLTAITCNIAFGDVTVENASVENMTAILNAGNIDAKNITCDSLMVRSDYGDGKFTNIKARDVDVDSSAGNIRLTDVSAADWLRIDTSYGDIDLEAVNAGKSEFNLSSGNFTASGVDIKNGIALKNAYGDIRIRGNVEGRSRIDSSSGNTDIELGGVEENYFVTVDASAGSVSLGGKNFGGVYDGHFEGRGKSSAPNKFEIHADYGDVSVSFRDS